MNGVGRPWRMFSALKRAFGRKPAEPGKSAEAWRQEGNAFLGQGALADAARCYRAALAAAPDDAAAHVSLGYVLLEEGDPAAAADLLQRVVQLPGAGGQAADAWFLLGRARQRQSDAAGAIEAYQQALAAQPGFAEAMAALVPLLLAAGRQPEALRAAQQLAAARPAPESGVLLAHAHYAGGEDRAALEILDSVLQAAPRHAGARTGRGHALLRLGDYEGAAAAFRNAMEAAGATPDRLADLASACHRLGRLDEAAALQAQALAMDPRHAPSLSLQVLTLTASLRLVEAESLAREALQQHPQDADLHWNLAIALLLQGKLAAGWAEHAWRWRASAMATTAPPPRPEPAWHGGPLAGARILLVAEQGFGDTIQFARYVPLVAQQAKEVVLQVPRPLHALLRGLAGNCEVVEQAPAGSADCQSALMDLPQVFGTTEETVPAAIPYLRADPERVAEWSQRLDAAPGRLKVGVAWSGNPAHTNDRRRSIPLARFATLLQADAQFFGLQTQVRPEDAQAAAGWPQLRMVGAQLGDFSDTAALLQALDLVITVDTSLAHLAGALGRPVWILLPHCPDWRWMVGRDDSPWYTTARLFRQATPGGWDEVLARVRAALDARAAAAA